MIFDVRCLATKIIYDVHLSVAQALLFNIHCLHICMYICDIRICNSCTTFQQLGYMGNRQIR